VHTLLLDLRRTFRYFVGLPLKPLYEPDGGRHLGTPTGWVRLHSQSRTPGFAGPWNFIPAPAELPGRHTRVEAASRSGSGSVRQAPAVEGSLDSHHRCR
jgi:hypothetical protein